MQIIVMPGKGIIQRINTACFKGVCVCYVLMFLSFQQTGFISHTSEHILVGVRVVDISGPNDSYLRNLIPLTLLRLVIFEVES